jgi:glycosyltransferase involved in cell wall biosynthesis
LGTLVFNGGTLARKELYGVQRNTLETLRELDRLVEPGQVELVIPGNSKREFRFENVRVVPLDGETNSTIGRYKWLKRDFPDYVGSRGGIGIDMLLALPTRNCEIVAIYDCTTELFPQNAANMKSKISRRLYMSRARKSLCNSNLVFTVSEHSKADLVKYYACDPDKIVVMYNGWQHMKAVIPDETILDELGIRGAEYFFSLGSRFAHKNFKWVAAAARQNPQYRFVVTGSEALSTSDRELEGSEPANLIFTGYLSDERIKALMSHCKAFILPSLYEGFGIPPLEAMSVGAPCIVSRAGSLPEIYDDAVRYIDPYQYEGIDLDEIMSVKPTTSSQVILDRYSWERSARIVYEALLPYLDE